MSQAHGGEAGFTLLEVVVALAVVSIVAATALTTVSGGVNADRRADNIHRTLKIARRRFHDWTSGNRSNLSGTDGALSWTIEARPLSPSRHRGETVAPIELVFIARSDTGQKIAEFRSIRFGPTAAGR
ncbi:MAG: prepilin-type N-terminal cleavage/methylation domain-containing protein [Pseudomonadota bacterium]